MGEVEFFRIGVIFLVNTTIKLFDSLLIEFYFGNEE